MKRALVILAAITALSACGGSNASTSGASNSAAADPAASLASAQGASTCHDIAAWIPHAMNEHLPRFTAQLETDEAQAQGTQLGNDMTLLDSNLWIGNAVALESENYIATGSADPVTGLSRDCSGYGVTLNWAR